MIRMLNLKDLIKSIGLEYFYQNISKIRYSGARMKTPHSYRVVKIEFLQLSKYKCKVVFSSYLDV